MTIPAATGKDGPNSWERRENASYDGIRFSVSDSLEAHERHIYYNYNINIRDCETVNVTPHGSSQMKKQSTHGDHSPLVSDASSLASGDEAKVDAHNRRNEQGVVVKAGDGGNIKLNKSHVRYGNIEQEGSSSGPWIRWAIGIAVTVTLALIGWMWFV